MIIFITTKKFSQKKGGILWLTVKKSENEQRVIRLENFWSFIINMLKRRALKKKWWQQVQQQQWLPAFFIQIKQPEKSWAQSTESRKNPRTRCTNRRTIRFKSAGKERKMSDTQAACRVSGGDSYRTLQTGRLSCFPVKLMSCWYNMFSTLDTMTSPWIHSVWAQPVLVGSGPPHWGSQQPAASSQPTTVKSGWAEWEKWQVYNQKDKIRWMIKLQVDFKAQQEI